MRATPTEVATLDAHRDYGTAVPTPDHFIPLLYLAGLAGAAGGGTDAIARGFAAQFEKELGGRVIVENRPGGATKIAATAAARAARAASIPAVRCARAASRSAAAFSSSVPLPDSTRSASDKPWRTACRVSNSTTSTYFWRELVQRIGLNGIHRKVVVRVDCSKAARD